MKLADVRLVQQLAQATRGILTTAELRIALGYRHNRSFRRTIDGLIDEGVLARFSRGVYLTEDADPTALSQRICEESYLSLATGLVRARWLTTAPDKRVWAVKLGPSRTYRGSGFTVHHLTISPNLYFGFERVDGVQWAVPEKALLDTLYYHQHGQRYYFDIYSDVLPLQLNYTRFAELLSRYKNHRFSAFARRYLETLELETRDA